MQKRHKKISRLMCTDHVISRGLVKIQSLEPARDPLGKHIFVGIYLHSDTESAHFQLGTGRAYQLAQCKFGVLNFFNLLFKIMLFYFPTLKDVAYKHCPLARSGEKWLSFQDAVSELGKGHDNNQRKKLGLQKPHRPATK